LNLKKYILLIIILLILTVLTIFLYNTLYLITKLITPNPYVFFMIISIKQISIPLIGIAIWSYLWLIVKKLEKELVSKKDNIKIYINSFRNFILLYLTSLILFISSIYIFEIISTCITLIKLNFPYQVSTNIFINYCILKLFKLLILSAIWVYFWIFLKKLDNYFLK